MYAFYADESGFSLSTKYEPEQPVLVTAGILIDFNRLTKAIEEFDKLLIHVNSKLISPVKELKFSEIRNKNPYRIALHKVEDRADLLEKIVFDFEKNIDIKIIYCAIDTQKYYEIRKTEPLLINGLKHPYLYSCYKMLCRLDKVQAVETNNSGKTFVVLDEQNLYQNKIEDLLANPIHGQPFTEIFDTAYFGKSHYSKLIQIADLIAGTFRYYLSRLKQGYTPENDYWLLRIQQIINGLRTDIIHEECFEGALKEVYDKIELKV